MAKLLPLGFSYNGKTSSDCAASPLALEARFTICRNHTIENVMLLYQNNLKVYFGATKQNC